MGEVKEEIEPKIISVQALLSLSLSIPNYQRPYKWSEKNVNQLIDDILQFKNKPAYRLGTIVFNQEKDSSTLHIVDGQQRTLTLLLIAQAIQNNIILNESIAKANIKLPNLNLLENLSFKNNTTKNNLRDNYRLIARRTVDFDVETVQFFYNKCGVVKVVLHDISEAFQFFDSQNARGKDLSPHDLLKAFHLREMAGSTNETERINAVNKWENMSNYKLRTTFSLYLFRIRQWSKGKSARHFTKNNIDTFKGISPTVKEPYPFANIYRISHFYIEGYNQDFNRNIDGREMDYPFQIDQVMINGKRFFELINHYVTVINQTNKNNQENKIIKLINDYPGMHRTGDKYVRNLFDCALIYYIDKFGEVELERVIERIFIWAYSLRLELHSVQLASIDNKALQYPNMFKRIKEALKPSDVLNVKLNAITVTKTIKTSPTSLKKVHLLIEKFDNLNYLNE